MKIVKANTVLNLISDERHEFTSNLKYPDRVTMYEKGYLNALWKINNLVVELPEYKVNTRFLDSEWIDCKKCKPNKAGQYLVKAVFDNCDGTFTKRIMIDNYTDEYGELAWRTDTYGHKVTHWTDLDGLYKAYKQMSLFINVAIEEISEMFEEV